MKTNQILQIVCITIGIYYVLAFFFGLVGMGMLFSMEDNEYLSKKTQVIWTIITLLTMLLISYVFIFKNLTIVKFIKSKTKFENSEADNSTTHNKPNLSFWIIIVGLYYFVDSISTLLSQLPEVLSLNAPFLSKLFWWNQTGSGIVGLIFSLFFIFQSNRIESFIKSKTNISQQGTQH